MTGESSSFAKGRANGPFSPPRSDLPPFDSIHDLAWDPKSGTLVAATNGGIFRIKPAEPFADSEIRLLSKADDSINLSLALEKGGEIWAGTSRGLIDPGLTRFTDKEGLCSPVIQSLAVDRSDRLWIGTDQGLMAREGSGFQRIASDQEPIQGWIFDLTTGSGHERLVSKEKADLLLEAILAGTPRRPETDPENPFRGGGSDKKAFLDSLEREIDHFKAQGDDKEKVYAAGSTGFFRIDPGKKEAQGVIDEWTTAVATAKTGNVFVATKEFSILPSSQKPSVFAPFSIANRLKFVLSGLITSELSGDFPAGVTSGLLSDATLDEIRGMGPTELGVWMESFLKTLPISALHLDPKGTLWVGLKGGGLFRIRVVDIIGDLVAGSVYRERKFGAGQVKHLCLETPILESPTTPDVVEGVSIVRDLYKDVFKKWPRKIWIGRCSELKDVDWQRVGKFIGANGNPQSLLQFVANLPHDPLLCIPALSIEEGKALLAERKEKIPDDKEKLKEKIESGDFLGKMSD